jgi:phenylpropionate dioxygenase-like ring-hydroxylating dioxygenase large terminal subunit
LNETLPPSAIQGAQAVQPSDGDGLLRDAWYFAASSAELKAGAQFRREILGQPVMLGRTKQGEPFALRDICPHRAVPLSAGRQVDTNGAATVECPYHGWRFGTDGQCKLLPSLVNGDEYDASRIRVRRYPVHEANGLVFVFVAADPRFDGAPEAAPDFGLGDAQPKFIVHQIFQATMDNAVVGLMDPAHVGFVHSQWWWRPPSTGLRLKEKQFEPRERGWAIARHAPSGNSIAYRALFGDAVTTEIVFRLPGYRWEIVENARARFFTLTLLTPETANATRITQATYWSNAPLLDIAKPFLIPAAKKFLAQDGAFVDLQNEGLKYQPGMLWIDDIDVQAKWYQRLKREWAASRAEKRAFNNPIEPVTLRWRS